MKKVLTVISVSCLLALCVFLLMIVITNRKNGDTWGTWLSAVNTEKDSDGSINGSDGSVKGSDGDEKGSDDSVTDSSDRESQDAPISEVQIYYVSESQSYVAENEMLKLTVGEDLRSMNVEDKRSGAVWNNTSQNIACLRGDMTDNLLAGVYANNLLWDYKNKFTAESSIKIKDNKLIISFSYKLEILPYVMTKKRFDEYLEKIDSDEKSHIKEYLNEFYKRYSIDKLSKSDKKNEEELLQKYPLLAKEDIVVLRDSTSPKLIQEFGKVFPEAGYSFDEMIADISEVCCVDNLSGVDDLSFINPVLTIELSLVNDSLLEEIYVSRSEFFRNISSIRPLFHLERSGKQEYFILNSGIQHVDPSDAEKVEGYSNSYKGYYPASYERKDLLTEEQRLSSENILPCFGTVENNSAVLCCAEKNKRYVLMGLSCYKNDSNIYLYSYFGLYFSICKNDKNEQSYFNDGFDGSVSVRYIFVDNSDTDSLMSAYTRYENK